ncbi:hypothetical protein X975_14914, partial [Stegodyphus mimosarum]
MIPFDELHNALCFQKAKSEILVKILKNAIRCSLLCENAEIPIEKVTVSSNTGQIFRNEESMLHTYIDCHINTFW